MNRFENIYEIDDNTTIHAQYWSTNNRFFMQSESMPKAKRISESAFISAYEYHHNY